MVFMQLPVFTQTPSFDVLPSWRLSRFYDDPEPPLAFFQGFFTEDGLHIQLKAYEQPTERSYFCFTLLSGKKLCFSKVILPNKADNSLQSISLQGENLIGRYWGSQLFVPYSLCAPPISGSIGLFHGNIPLCFLHDELQTGDSVYPLVRFNPEQHPKSSSPENLTEDR